MTALRPILPTISEIKMILIMALLVVIPGGVRQRRAKTRDPGNFNISKILDPRFRGDDTIYI
jgi:hypothetical protein